MEVGMLFPQQWFQTLIKMTKCKNENFTLHSKNLLKDPEKTRSPKKTQKNEYLGRSGYYINHVFKKKNHYF